MVNSNYIGKKVTAFFEKGNVSSYEVTGTLKTKSMPSDSTPGGNLLFEDVLVRRYLLRQGFDEYRAVEARFDESDLVGMILLKDK